MRSERGQVLPFMLIGLLVVLLGFAGLVVDVGQSYWAKRQLQAATDAAALAAAQELPDQTVAQSLASQYTALNPVRGTTVDPPVFSTRCLNRTPTCNPATPNAVVIQSTAHVSTTFARLFGFDSMTVSAKATACSPCGSRPLDVMFVIDRTGSMCQFHDGTSDPACTDLANARAGMEAFLQLMDPRLDRVGLAVLPPYTIPYQGTPSLGVCDPPYDSWWSWPFGTQYVLTPLSNDYLVNGQLNTSSALVSTIRCIKGGGGTAYATALEAAQRQLVTNGRPNVQKVIVFMSDGAANLGPCIPGQCDLSSPYLVTPCHQGVNSAAAIKAAGTLIYSIGYDVNPVDDGFERCKNAVALSPDGRTHLDEAPTITAYQALNQIASPGDFYLGNALTAAQMQSIFSTIARDILHGTSNLVRDDA